MSMPTMPKLSASRSLPLRWPRIGALSTSFSLHGVAAALFLLAVSAPRVHLPPERVAPAMAVTIVEPPPQPAPTVPVEPASQVVAATVTPAPPAPPMIQSPARFEPRPLASARPAPPPGVAVPPPATTDVAAASTLAASASASVDYGTVSRPAYPGAALRRGAQGDVMVRIRVDPDGRPGRIELARSSGDRDLDRAALQAVRSWRFQPALAAGRPVAAWVVVPVAFRLDNR